MLRKQAHVANREPLQQIIAREPAAGLSYRQLTAFYTEQDLAARQLEDRAALERILRRWIKEVPDNFTPRWTLWRLLAGSERQQEGLQVGESVVRDAVWQFDIVRANSLLAGDYLEAGNLARTHTLLFAAQKVITDSLDGQRLGSDGAFWTAWAKGTYFLTQCRLSVTLHQFVPALAHCRRSDEYSRQQMAASNLVSAFQMNGGANHHVDVLLMLAIAELGAARPFDAQSTTRRAMSLARSYGVGRLGYSSFYQLSATTRIEQHDYAGAQQIAAEALSEIARSEQSPAGKAAIELRSSLLLSYVGQARWADAQALLDAMDRDVEGNELAQRAALNLHARAITALMHSRSATMRSRLRTALHDDEEKFGPEHFMTGLTRGFYALALAESVEPDEREHALHELARSVASITTPSTLGEEYSDAGLRRVYRRLILESYLDLATRRAVDDQIAATLFRVADYLRASTVQRALSEAAARSAASTAGLAEVVRRDQDAANELRGLMARMTEQPVSARAPEVDDVVAQLRQRISELERLRGAFRNQIANQFPDYDQLVNPQPPAPAEIAQRLNDGEVFISLLPAREFVYVWAVGRNGTSFHRAAIRGAALNTLVQRVRKTLDVAEVGVRATRFDAEASALLFETLFKPLSARLQGARHLVVAPGGVLGQLPMSVLLTAPWASGDTEKAPWLVKQVVITHVASASAWMSLHTLAKAKPASEAFAAWGDPLFDKDRPGQLVAANRALNLTRAAGSLDLSEVPPVALSYRQIPALPETRQEIEAIAASLGALAADDAYFGERATRESVLTSSRSGLLANKRVVVFATHGLVPGDLPNLTQPALALAANGQEQTNPLAPLLTLEDVLTLKLNADWVVLSACNTAAADGKAEEALSGLARGFFYAGSRSLLVTHWAVESESAKELTTRTFAHYAANPSAPKAESLRHAMLKVMAMPQFSHPAYWAPFALVGGGG